MRISRSISSLITICAVLALTGARAGAQTNLLANPGFEANGGSYDGWFTFGAGVQLSTPDTDNIIRTDTTAAKIYGEFTGCPNTPTFDVGGFGQAFTPTAGNLYELTGYSFVSGADVIPGSNTCQSNRLIAKVVFFDAASGGNELASNEVVIGDWKTTLEQWNEFTVETPCPTGALRVEALFLFLQPGCDTGSVFVDDVAFYEKTPDTPAEPNILTNESFTGGLTGWTVFGNAYAEPRTFALRTRTGSAKLFGPFAAPGDASGMFQTFPATGDSDWQFSIYSMTTCMESPINVDNDNYGVIQLVFVDDLYTVLGTQETVIIDNTSPLGTWRQHTVTGTAPAGTDSVQAYVLFVQPTSSGGAFWVDDAYMAEVASTGIEDGTIPSASKLYQNTPNPFNPATSIDFYLAEAGNVEIKVHDVSGRLVATLFSGHKDAGHHTVNWDGRSSGGSRAASGVYFYSMTAGPEVRTRKMVLLR